MISNLNTEPSSPNLEDDKSDFFHGTCRAFRKLKNWQIEQYRKAVDENKWYMNEKSDRFVDWSEAEADFIQNSYYGCAAKWRQEYCSQHCGYFSGCELGIQLCRISHQPAPTKEYTPEFQERNNA